MLQRGSVPIAFLNVVMALACAARAETLDLARAAVVLPPAASAVQAQATRMLVEEVEKRTQLRLPVVDM